MARGLTVGPAALALAAAAVAACSPFGGGAFSCTDSAQCGADGVCEANMLCSFPDPGCGSGRSYGQGAGDLAGVCVGDEPVDAAVPADAGPDAPPGADAAIDALVGMFCDPGDPDLRLCLAFDGDVGDGSSYATAVAPTSITFVPGQVGQAVVLTPSSRLEIGEVANMDFDRMTIEAWIQPIPLPPTGRAGILDNNGQYGFFLYPTGELRCTPRGGLMVPAAIQAGVWTHVACTFDGTTETVYVDGAPVGSLTSSGTLGTGGTDGSSIGGDNPPPNDRFTGMIDQLRVYSEGRSAAQICDDAGHAGC